MLTRKNQFNSKTKKIWLWVLLLTVTLSWSSVSANDGSDVFFDASSGGYHITLTVQPEVVAVGEVHFSITLTESDSMVPGTDAERV